MQMIDFKEAKCTHCYKCVRYCDVKAVMIKQGKAEIIEDRCVLCGHCLHVCPQSAKTMISDVDKVKYYLKSGEKVIVSLAPSYMGYWRETSLKSLKAAFQKLGFCDVRETAEGAAVITEEYARLLQAGEMENIITTCCPSVNDLIEIHYPELIPYMAPVVSPMVAHGRMLKKEYGSDYKVVFVGPCIAKKKEAADERYKDAVDAVLNFADVRRWMNECQIDIKKEAIVSAGDDSNSGFDPAINRIYPVSSGVIQSVLSTSKVKDTYRKLHVHGTKYCIELCESLKCGELTHSFIELNMCQGGCINGSAPLDHETSRFVVKAEMQETIEAVAADKNAVEKAGEGVILDTVYNDKSRKTPEPTEEELREILQKTGKFTEADELNCGACGYNTCREKAIAVYQGKAELSMCIPYIYEKAESMSNLVMDTTPNIILMVDKDMKILDYSAVGATYFGKTREQAMDMYLYEFIDPTDFQWVYNTHQNIQGKKVTFDDYHLTVLMNVVYVEKRDLVLATLIDITSQEEKVRAEYEKKLKTVELAHEVIKKQMTVAQEIAGLLGETTAETKVTLLDLCESLLEEKE